MSGGVKTTCPWCGAEIVQRVHLTVTGCGDQSPLFAETYRCGAVRVWGLLDTEAAGSPRRCKGGRPR